jgi:GDP-4-dehydro-6-deoxy-D-mannose reductase
LLKSYYQCDLTETTQVATVPFEKYNAIINLAGLAKVGDSFADPEMYMKVNVEVFSILAERLSQLKAKTRVIAISTGAVYDPDQPMPLTEGSNTVQDGSPYAASKLMMEESVRTYRKKGVDCVIARPFNHSGPGQAEGFLIPDLYQNIITAAKTGEQPVKVGNLDTRRDYTDVRDIAKAYVDLAVSETLSFDTYNVCSGTSRAGREILNTILDETGLKDKVAIEVDESLIRPSDPPELYGSYERLEEETGWSPSIPFEQTVCDFIASQTEKNL